MKLKYRQKISDFIHYRPGRWFETWHDKGWITERTWDRWEDWYDLKLADPLLKFGCKLFGHMPEMDHCGMPKHDLCGGCWTRTPGEADRSFLTRVHPYGEVCHGGYHFRVKKVDGSEAVDDDGKRYPTAELEPLISEWLVKDPLLNFQPHACPKEQSEDTDPDRERR